MSRTGANIYKRKDGRWEGRYIKGHTSDKAKYGYIYGKTYKEVKMRLIQALTERQNEISNVEAQHLFTQIANEWLEQSKAFIKESTFVKYQNLLNSYLLPEFQKYNVSEITNDKIYHLGSTLLVSGGEVKDRDCQQRQYRM